jgi:hypothetical protein
MTIQRSVLVAGIGLWAFGISACGFIGIEPDDIDVATDESSTGGTGVTTTQSGDGDGDPGGDGDGDPTGPGDGDGDGDGETEGPDDGDGDPSGDGDGDGDGDADPRSCLPFSPVELEEGDNQVEVLDGVSALSSECGGVGPESVYQFTAPAEGTWQFVIEQSEFTEVLALVGSCAPLQELACSPAPATIEQFLSQGQVVFVIVDSDAGTGTATLTIAML